MKYVKQLSFGPPKSGKTTMFGTFPEPQLVLNFDPGGPDVIHKEAEILSPQQFQEQMKTKRVDWKPLTVLDFSGGTGKITLGKNRPKTASIMNDFINSANCLFDHLPFKSVALDSYSGLDDAVISYILALNCKDQMEIQHWGQASTKKEEIVAQLLSLPCHVVIIAHSESKKDEVSGSINTIPFGSGKLQEKLGVYFSQVVFHDVTSDAQGKPKYVLYTRPRGTTKGLGCRFPQNLADVVEPSWEKVYAEYYRTTTN